MELLIDQKVADLPLQTITIPAFDCRRFADPNASREGRKLQLTLPATAGNSLLFGQAHDPETGQRFNADYHTAALVAEGVILLQGQLRLLSASKQGYRVELRESGSSWAQQAARRRIEALGVDYETTLNPTNIVASWSSDSPVKFLPIARDAYPQQSNSTDLLPAERLLSVDDYHPFLHLESLLRQLFAEAGYTIESRFFESELFRSLYMSGAYRSRDTTAAANRMGFLARRLTSVSAQANHLGRVYADPYTAAYSLGNVVESASPQAVDADGVVLGELYNNGNCFGQDADGAICFTPSSAVSVGFEYYFKYTTDHRILSRTRLKGFDSIYLGAGSDLRFHLANRYVDRRDHLTAGYAYRAIVFDHEAGAHYRLRCEVDGVEQTWVLFSERAALVTTPTAGVITNPALDHLEEGWWTPYTGDWALYDGYIEEEGQTTVEVRLRTTSEELAAGEVKHFDQLYFYGAEEGMTLTLDKCCSLRPRFLASVGFGATIRFEDLAQIDSYQITLLEAVAHLFNLRFVTDEATRTVQIEPYDDFYRPEPVDWSDRIDHTEPIRLIDSSIDLHEVQTWCYEAGDGAVKRWEEAAGRSFGSWSSQTASAAALLGEEVHRNPLFRPSLLIDGHYENAPSALLLQVGDRDSAEEDGTNFTPRIVALLGMHSLPEGERWGYPAEEASYPLAVFHFAGDEETAPATLCFEDRDGVEGLHRFYDRQLRHLCEAGEIELTLRLAPHDYAALFALDHGGGDLRSRFRLATDEGVCFATLAHIGSYNPLTGAVRCLFNRCDR